MAARGRSVVLILVVFLVLVVIGSIVAVVAMIDGGPGKKAKDGSVLVLDIAGSLPQQPVPESPLAGLQAQPLSMLEIDSALTKAAVDDNIARLLVRPGPLAAGPAKLQELRGMLLRYKETAGKPVTCWMEAGGNAEYQLATACDEIFLAPEGLLFVNGFNLSVTFYKGTLDKLGVEADFARAGKYKSAVEPMTSEEMSPAYREMLNEMADSLFDEFVANIAEGRGLDEATVRALIDDPPLTASAAVRAGLADGLMYRDQLLRHLAGEEVELTEATTPTLAGLLWDDPEEEDLLLRGETAADPLVDGAEAPAPEPPAELAPADDDDSGAVELAASTDEPEVELIGLGEYGQVKPSSLGLSGDDEVAIVFCEGQITSGKSQPGRSMGSDTIAAAVRAARKDDDIKAIVLRIDSPGGSGLASDIIWREVELAKRTKPVVVSMSTYAASGGYYIAMGADAIVAEPGTLTGSIGVFGGKYNLSGLFDKVGLNVETVKRGEYADLFAASKPLGDAGRSKLQEYIDGFYEVFIEKVAQGRGTTPMAIHEIAQGRVWTGEQGLKVGLVDELGGFRTALALAKEKAGIDGHAKLRLFPRQPTFLEQLLDQGVGPALTLRPLMDRTALLGGDPGLGSALSTADHLLSALPLMSSGQVVAMSPYRIEVR